METDLALFLLVGTVIVGGYLYLRLGARARKTK